MSGYPGYYSLIQYCPDRSRAEVANVGVVLFCPSLRFIDARTAGGNDRVRRFFRGRDIDIDRLNLVKRGIEKRLQVQAASFTTIADLVGFIETRANDIVLTTPRSIKVTDPHADLDQLFQELVGGRQRRELVSVGVPELDEPFSRLRDEGKVWTKEHVRVPVLGTLLRAPYAYKNGAVNLVMPFVFARHEDEARRKAGHLAIEGDLLAKYAEAAGQRYKLVVVSGGQGAVLDQRESAFAPLFDEYSVRFVRRQQIPEFVQQVEREAHA